MEARLYQTARICGRSVAYFLILESTEQGMLTYGIRVRSDEEETVVRNLSTSFETVVDLLETFVRGEVTPVSVPDLIEDWLAG